MSSPKCRRVPARRDGRCKAAISVRGPLTRPGFDGDSLQRSHVRGSMDLTVLLVPSVKPCRESKGGKCWVSVYIGALRPEPVREPPGASLARDYPPKCSWCRTETCNVFIWHAQAPVLLISAGHQAPASVAVICVQAEHGMRCVAPCGACAFQFDFNL